MHGTLLQNTHQKAKHYTCMYTVSNVSTAIAGATDWQDSHILSEQLQRPSCCHVLQSKEQTAHVDHAQLSEQQMAERMRAHNESSFSGCASEPWLQYGLARDFGEHHSL